MISSCNVSTFSQVGQERSFWIGGREFTFGAENFLLWVDAYQANTHVRVSCRLTIILASLSIQIISPDSYQFWAPGEPSGLGITTDQGPKCVELRPQEDYKWYHVPCNRNNSGICQYDLKGTR